jgi:putative transposase
MQHIRGAPYHPMTQGKNERRYQTLKNRILLENYYLPGDLEGPDRDLRRTLHQRYHQSLGNLTPADVYFGRDHINLLEREKIKHQTVEQRRLQHCKSAA